MRIRFGHTIYNIGAIHNDNVITRHKSILYYIYEIFETLFSRKDTRVRVYTHDFSPSTHGRAAV